MTIEGNISKGIQEYLTIGQRQGKWWWSRLNSGSVLVQAGPKRYRLQLCEEGTPDLMVIKKCWPQGAPNKWETRVIFFEVKRPGKKPTGVQLERQAELKSHGAECYNVSTIDEVIEELE